MLAVGEAWRGGTASYTICGSWFANCIVPGSNSKMRHCRIDPNQCIAATLAVQIDEVSHSSPCIARVLGGHMRGIERRFVHPLGAGQ